jgi:hypothetical protein
MMTLLLVAALLGKVLAPAGWMPVATAQGFTFMLCSDQGQTQAWVDGSGRLHRGEAPGPAQPAAKDACPYGALAAAAALPDAPALAAHLPAGTRAPALRPAGVTIGRGLAAPPPPATGPPHSA